jgi:hypothetical protein
MEREKDQRRRWMSLEVSKRKTEKKVQLLKDDNEILRAGGVVLQIQRPPLGWRYAHFLLSAFMWPSLTQSARPASAEPTVVLAEALHKTK